MRKIIVIITLTAIAAGAGAQRRMSLAGCIEMAERQSTAMKTGRLEVEKARTLEATAFEAEKTGLSLSQDPTSGGSPDNALTLSQTFAFPTVYGARRKALRAETGVTAGQLELTRLALQRDVAAAYYKLLYHIERRRILEKQTGIYRNFMRIAQAKLQAGESGRLEWINAERLIRENELAVAAVGNEVTAAAAGLQLLLNTDSVVMPAEDSLTVVAALPDNDFSVETTPGVQALEAEVKAGRNRLTAERHALLPDITVAARTQLVIGAFNPYNEQRERYEKGNFMGFEVGLSIPLFYGASKARIKAARQDIAIAEHRREAELAETVRRRRAALAGVATERRILDYYATEGQQRAAQIERISETAYENGEIGYLEYVENLQTAFDIHNKWAEAVDKYNQALINLKYIEGESIR